MKNYKLIIFILVIFFKTGNVLSYENIFNVNNIEIAKNPNKSNEQLAYLAIKKAFKELKEKILLEKDYEKLSKLKFSEIKDLVSYYQVFSGDENNEETDKIRYNIFFDKDKLHSLFFTKEIFYSEIIDNEIFLLPILKKNNQYFVYNKNFFYENWNQLGNNELIEFILPIENIEIIQKINSEKNVLDLNLSQIFKEYVNKNLALILIDERNNSEKKIFLKTRIMGRNINKSIIVKSNNIQNDFDFNKKIISNVKNEIENLIKSQNLIDVRTPSFINTKLSVSSKNTLVELNKRLKKIDSIQSIYVQELNNSYVLIKIKYFGKLNKIIKQLKDHKIILKLSGDSWSIKIT